MLDEKGDTTKLVDDAVVTDVLHTDTEQEILAGEEEDDTTKNETDGRESVSHDDLGSFGQDDATWASFWFLIP